MFAKPQAEERVVPSALVTEPAFRATWAKYTIGSIKRMPPRECAQLLNAVGDELRAEVRRASSLGWQDARVFSGLCGRIASCGRDVALRFWRQSLRESIEKPLISVLVQGGLALVGRSPMALFARTPRAFSLVARECGRLQFEPGEGDRTGTILVEGMPPICREHPGLLLLLEGGFQGQADYVGGAVEVKVDARQFTHSGSARFNLRW